MNTDDTTDTESPITRISEKGQTTIPKEFRERLGIDAGDELEWELTDEGIVVRKHTTSGRGSLLPDEDESTRQAVVEDLMEQNREERASAAWNIGEDDG